MGRGGEAENLDVQATLVAAIFPPSFPGGSPLTPALEGRKLFLTSILYLVSVNSSTFGK